MLTATSAIRFAVGVIIGTAIVEVALRIDEVDPLWKALPVAAHLPVEIDQHTAFAHAPNSAGFWLDENRAWVSYNSLGLRDVERAIPKPTGVFRVAVLGDSMTEALQVQQEETFVALAEGRLNATSARRVELVNLGLSNAYDAVQIEQWRAKGSKLDADALVVIVGTEYLTYSFLRDDTVLPAYRQNEQGQWFISHAFREGPEHRFVRSSLGAASQKALEYVRLARVVRKRWHAGLWQGLGATGQSAHTAATCADLVFDAQWRLWIASEPTLAAGRLDAYLADLAEISRAHAIPASVLFMSPRADCPDSIAKSTTLGQAIEARLNGYGLRGGGGLVANEMRSTVDNLRSLYGFRAQVGHGHLNQRGHQLMSAVLASAVTKLMAEPRPMNGR